MRTLTSILFVFGFGCSGFASENVMDPQTEEKPEAESDEERDRK